MTIKEFQSTLPARGATNIYTAQGDLDKISIHAPRTGSDALRYLHMRPRSISIHAPRTGSDTSSSTVTPETFISIHAPRTGSDKCVTSIQPAQKISIHAPRTGSDINSPETFILRGISIHAPRTGSDADRQQLNAVNSSFQSTLPARGATGSRDTGIYRIIDFNPRSPHGERRRTRGKRAQLRHFNPRSPHGERLCGAYCVHQQEISIHAPRTGSDLAHALASPLSADFNPRSPHGERQNVGRNIAEGVAHFNPRSPHGERQFPRMLRTQCRRFQSTLPARGATLSAVSALVYASYFNPRSPHGERQCT